MNRSEFTAPSPCRRGMLAGVCAAFAAFVDVPVWMTRAVAVLLLLWHPIVAIIVYLAFATFIRRGRGRFSQRLSTLRDHVAPPRAPDMPPPPIPPIDGLASRFANLDLRLARLEARVTDPDHLLRRRFDRL
ncbi:MAG: PspC domain-containing protein [Acidiphilium sp.]|nr:PspC domain-containing protein [Acidiphilium sp.]MDD4935855.1 PspC domain-containing protein [Acidiphilium sp.]